MWSVFGTSVCRAWTCVNVPHYRVLSAGRAGLVAAARRRLTQRLCCTDAATVRSCTVDPQLEEEFVFVDSTGEADL